jgi:hypothetical protein
MGAVFRSKDLGKGYKKIVEGAIKDLSPDTRDSMIKLLDNNWEDIGSSQKLKEILGPSKAERLLEKIKENKDVDLTDEDRKALKDILKDSLTFD